MTGSTLPDLRRRELGRILRSYRDLVGPREVGLPAGGRRRAPGLRREEVAVLAGVGVTWYTWLEQGRVSASDDVLDAVGRVFGIDEVGRRHLRVLSRPRPVRPVADAEGLRPVLDGWASGPAALLDAHLGVVAANETWTGVWGSSVGRHVLSVVTGAPHARVDDPTPLVRALARQFRMIRDLDPDDPGLALRARELRTGAPDLGPVWACRGVGAFGRPLVRIDGVERAAHLLGEVGPSSPFGPAVLVLPAHDAR